MADDIAIRELFDRWESVWHQDRHELVASCIAPVYIRHDAGGVRSVTADGYVAELIAVKTSRPGIRVVVYDHAFDGNRAWFRFNFMWKDAATQSQQTQAGLQSYRVEDGKLAETWIALQAIRSAWPDARAQETWTSKLAIAP